MQVIQNRLTNGLIQGLSQPEQIRLNGLTNTLVIKRADSGGIDWLFATPFVGFEEFAGTPELKFAAKVSTQRDGSFVVSNWDGAAFAFTKLYPQSVSDAVLNSTTTVTSATAAFSPADIGKTISATGIPARTTIASVQSATTITLSQPATGAATGVTITIVGRATTYRLAPAWNTAKLNNLLGNDPNGFAEVTEVRCIAGTNLDGKWFKLYDNAGSVGVWFDVAGGTTVPTMGTDRALEITGVTAGMTASQVAAQLATELDVDAKFGAMASGALVTVTDASIGTRAAAADGALPTGFNIARWITGSAPLTLGNQPYVDLVGELEVTLDSGEVFSTLDFTVRVYFDVIQGNEGQAPDPTPAWSSPINYIQILPTVTGYVGGSTKLDGVATVGLPAGVWRAFDHASDGLRIYKLCAGTAAEESPGIIRPDDYASPDNEKYWLSRL